MEMNELKRMKELEEENRKLKHMYADLALDNKMLKEVLGKKLTEANGGSFGAAFQGLWFRTFGLLITKAIRTTVQTSDWRKTAYRGFLKCIVIRKEGLLNHKTHSFKYLKPLNPKKARRLAGRWIL